MSFGKIMGNTALVKNLKTVVRENKSSHAYIFDGQKGLGKKTIAGAFAKALLCEDNRLGDACGQCVACRTFDSGNNPDVAYVGPTKTKSISVDDIREQINNEVLIKPFKYRYRVFIMDEANIMTPAAQNALLKTLETPPDYCVFLLLSSNISAFLPTILSRSVIMKLRPLPVADAAQFLMQSLSLNKDEAYFYAAYSGGNIGRAQELSADEGFVALRKGVVGIVGGLETLDLPGFYGLFGQLEGMKDSIFDALDIMHGFYRDALVYKEAGETYVFATDELPTVRLICDGNSIKNIIAKLSVVERTRRALKLNGNFQMNVYACLTGLYLRDKGL